MLAGRTEIKPLVTLATLQAAAFRRVICRRNIPSSCHGKFVDIDTHWRIRSCVAVVSILFVGHLLLVWMKSATTCLQPSIQSDCHGDVAGTTDDEQRSSLTHHIDKEKVLRASGAGSVWHFHCSAEGDSAQKQSGTKSHGIQLFRNPKRDETDDIDENGRDHNSQPNR